MAKLIAIEGIDGAGLSTQSQLLEEYLRKKGHKVILTKEPTVTLLGGLIKSALRNEWKVDPLALQLLFAADRANHLAFEITPALKKGFDVIMDRYYFSTIAYGEASGIDRNFLKQLNSKFRRPEILIILDLPAKIAINRIKETRFSLALSERRQFLEKVRIAFRKIFQENKDIAKVVDAAHPIQEVHKEIREFVESKL
ncbi:MAG: dTMP kinase [Candidatus Nanoarchaeia archaeon]|nr:dTMP kinase [Candidatus Haiyanarchaeum thermophilum]MCW1303188.1 dTMP kinase [Candidatus Haiyanarchaeum thermophilum]MCW1303854.1 dTMP kinase [Candidatus Haiyanarchaeum thermophilum]MCW1306530.1 dTMP kinase [Candidatus Haiyanarchaeum thermophilum]MCW1306943.1 dTMP kinase [Candidatus Haiyanarchaeum thermophilum]